MLWHMQGQTLIWIQKCNWVLAKMHFFCNVFILICQNSQHVLNKTCTGVSTTSTCRDRPRYKSRFSRVFSGALKKLEARAKKTYVCVRLSGLPRRPYGHLAMTRSYVVIATLLCSSQWIVRKRAYQVLQAKTFGMIFFCHCETFMSWQSI